MDMLMNQMVNTRQLVVASVYNQKYNEKKILIPCKIM